MFNKKILIFLIVIAFLFIPFSFASENADNNQTILETGVNDVSDTIYVNSEIGNDNNNGTVTNPVKTINQAISLSENGGIISLNGTFKGSGNTEITINNKKANDLTFVGCENTVINGMGSTYLFSITSGNASFINLTLMNGYKAGRGAAISITSGRDLYVENVTFDSNVVAYSPKGYSGGAIYVSKGKLYVYNSTFIKNEVKQVFYGGAIYLKDGAEGFVYNSRFLNNSAYLGGAIYASTDCSISVDGSLFYANNVYGNGATTRYGGAIYSNKYMTVTNSTFISNVASGGGALYSPLEEDDSIIVENSRFYYNVAANGNGGAILSKGSVKVKDSAFVENDAIGSGLGGAIYANDADVNYTVFTNNTATEGSAVAGDGNINVSYSSLVDNTPSFVYSSSNTADIDYNWWGENNPQVSASVIAILKVSCDENPIPENYGVLINTGLYWKGTDTIANVPRGNITLKSNGGNLNNSVFSSNSSGSFVISSILDNEIQTLTVNVQGADLVFIYVSKDGNDSNEGSINDPILTLNHAVEIANSNFNTVIFMSDGTYDENELTINRNTTIYGENTIINVNKLDINSNLNLANITINGAEISNSKKAIMDNLTLNNCKITNTGDSEITESIINNSTVDNRADMSISYSSIINSTVLNPTDADYNWWGSNVPQLSVNAYAVLNLSSDKSSLIKNETANIKVDMYWNGTQTKASGIQFNNVKLASEGVLNQTEGKIIDSSFITTFSADQWDTYNITALLDNEKQNISVVVKRMDLETLYVAEYGNDSNEGTFNSPLLTLTKALEIANSNPITEKIQLYAGVYDEDNFEIKSDITVTGGQNVVIINDIINSGNAKLSHLILNATSIINNGTLTIIGCDLSDNIINNTGALDITESYITDCEVVGQADIYYNSIRNLKCENADIDYNWWQSNTAPENVNVYAVLNVTANPLEMRSRVTSRIYARLYWNGTDDQVGIRRIPQRAINLTSTGGTLDITEDNFTSYFTTNFKAALPDKYNITVCVDDEIQTITVTVVPESNMTVVYANSSTGDDISGDGSAENPVKTIKRAIELACDNAKIILTGEFLGDGNVEIELDSTTSNNLTFIGMNDALINGEYKNWLFEITNGNATFMNISLDNSYKQGFGGAIYIHPRYHLTLINVFSSDNYVTNGGCGAAVYGGDIDIYGGEFINNRASIRGGAIVSIGHINMNGTSFIKNTVNTEGAAIYASTVNINNSNFLRNVVHGSGGAIFLSATVKSSFIENTLFESNKATQEYGGAISTKANLIVKDSQFDQNVGYGSAAIDNNGNLTVINCVFVNNNATDRDAGALSNLANCEIINSTFRNNTAFRNGGAIKNQAGNMTITNCQFISNAADGDDSGSYGGALYAWMANTTIISSSFSNNSAPDRGGAVYTSAGNGGSATLTGYYCEFINNTAYYGGGLFIESADGNFTNSAIVNSTVLSNIPFNIEYNWWGESNPNWDELLQFFIEKPQNYAVLDFKANPDTLSVGNSSQLTFNLYWNNSTQNALVPTRSIALTAQGGDLSKNQGLLDGEFSTTFTLNDHNNLIRAIVDNEIMECTFDMRTNTTLSVLTSNITYGEVLMLNVSIEPLIDANVSIFVGDDKFNLSLAKGYGQLNLSDLDVGNYSVVVEFKGDADYRPSNATAFVIVSEAPDLRKNTTLSISLTDIAYGEAAIINITSSPLFNGNLSVIIGDNEFDLKLINGLASLKLDDLTVGEYSIFAKFDGDENYKASNASASLKVSKSDDYEINDTLTDILRGQNLTFDVILPEDATGNVEVKVNDEIYVSKITDGTARFDISGLNTGQYDVEISYLGDENYQNQSISRNVSVNGPTIIAPDVDKYYSGLERFRVQVLEGDNTPIANAKVTITINGVTYNRTTDKNGNTSIAINMNSGTYLVTVGYEDIIKNATVNILTTVNGSDVIKVFRNATQYYATFKDSNGNYLSKGTMIRFNINGVFYDRSILDDKGLARLNLNLEQGNYILTAINLETGEMSSNNITILSRIVENHDLVKYYRNASQYLVKLIGDDGNAVGANESVTFNINGVFYTRYTNASGIAKLNINLEPGEYIITAEYKNCRVSNNIEVKPVLSASDLSMSYRDGSKFECRLIDGQGNPFRGESITFNINGVFYNRITDGDGIARLNINLMRGEYIITSSYNGENIANTIMIN